jgi:hypothetical protein
MHYQHVIWIVVVFIGISTTFVFHSILIRSGTNQASSLRHNLLLATPFSRQVLWLNDSYPTLPIAAFHYRHQPKQQQQQQSEQAQQCQQGKQSQILLGNETHLPSLQFGACLLLMDDSHRLPEWTAYHYFVLPLQYLIVAIDPYSRNDTTIATIEILCRWKPYLKHLTIWTHDSEYNFNKTGHNRKGIPIRANQHRLRQRYFYRACTIRLQMIFIQQQQQQQKQTQQANDFLYPQFPPLWTTFHDIDEFITLNSLVVPDAATKMKQPYSIGNYLAMHIGKEQPRDGTTKWQSPTQLGENANVTCIGMPRIMYSAVESDSRDDNQERYNEYMPGIFGGWDYKVFQSLRWRHRTAVNDTNNNLKGKAMMDITRLPVNHKLPSLFEVHQPIASTCPPPLLHSLLNAPLIIHHYLGSWDWYSYRRNDARIGHEKTATAWQQRSALRDGGMNDELCGWLYGFIEWIGMNNARMLLRGAGQLLLP